MNCEMVHDGGVALLRLLWRSVRVRRAHFDRWGRSKAFFEIVSDLHHRVRDPPVEMLDVTFFLQVGQQIDDLR